MFIGLGFLQRQPQLSQRMLHILDWLDCFIDVWFNSPSNHGLPSFHHLYFWCVFFYNFHNLYIVSMRRLRVCFEPAIMHDMHCLMQLSRQFSTLSLRPLCHDGLGCVHTLSQGYRASNCAWTFTIFYLQGPSTPKGSGLCPPGEHRPFADEAVFCPLGLLTHGTLPLP